MKFAINLILILQISSAVYAQLTPSDYYKTGKIKFEDGNYPESILLLTKTLLLDSTFDDAWYIRGRDYFELYKYDSAINDFTKAINLLPVSDPAGYIYFLYRGMSFTKKDEYFSAGKDFDEAKKLNSSDPEIFFEDANLKYITQKDKTEAIKDLDIAIELDPDYAPYYEKRADYKFYQSKYNFSAHEIIESAIRDMTFAISIDPSNYEYYERRTELYKTNGEPFLAIQDYSKMISLDPDKVKAYTERGIIQMQNADYKDAVLDFSAAIDKNPEDEKNYRFRGLCRYNSSDYRGAYQDYSTSIGLLAKINSTASDKLTLQRILADTYIKRGVSSVSMGNDFNACDDFRKAYELGASKGLNYYRKYCGF